MTRQKIFLFLALIGVSSVIAGCTSFDSMNSEIVPPTLIEKTSLPQPPAQLANRDFYLRMELLVGKDGSVRHVTLTRSTGDAEWDSAAVQQMMRWKFSPALLNGKPIQMRIMQTAKVVSSQPEMMDLSEIVVATSAQADSACALLKKGASFDSTAALYRLSVPTMPSGRIGQVDIHRFPNEVQDELRGLKRGTYTYALPLGSYFVIFKRH